MDTSMRRSLLKATDGRLRFSYLDRHPLQIVDFKLGGANLNGYEACARAFATRRSLTPFDDLREIYPARVIDPIQEVYARP